MINYSKDKSSKPLFKIGMRIPEFYSPPINNGNSVDLFVDKIKVVKSLQRTMGKK